MSLVDTREIATAKIVMVQGSGGSSVTPNPSTGATDTLLKLGIDGTVYNVGKSYTAGTGINIVGDAIHNTESGARSGIIDSISSSRAHTQITLATNETFKPYETLILHSATSGTADILRIQYASAASSVYDFNFYDRDGATAKTVSLEDGKTIIVMLDQTGHKAIVLSEIVSEVPLSIAHGGTGNIYGYIRTGKKAGTSFYAGATIEGYDNTNEGAYAHAEGQDNTIASTAQASHVEGYYNTVSGQNGHAEGQRNQASNTNAHAEGYYTVASGEASHAEGGIEIVGANRYPNTASGKYSHAEGGGNTASGNYSHVEGRRNLASAYTAHAEGASTTANNDSAHSEGDHTLASSTASHAEGSHSTASGVGAHSEGSAYIDFDSGNYVGNTASGEGAHAEGMGTTASGTASHTEGYGTSASGNYSHASGGSTTAGYAYQTVVGKINDNKSSTLFEVGNGTGANARSNAFEVYSDGKISCDNGSSKYKFTQNNGSDGYYDASGVFHAFGGSGKGGIPHISEMPSFTMDATDRFSRIAGGWKIVGKKCYVNILLKLNFAMQAVDFSQSIGEYDSHINTSSNKLPPIYNNGVSPLNAKFMEYDSSVGNRYYRLSQGVASAYTLGSKLGAEISIGTFKSIDGSVSGSDIRCIIYGEYDTV